MTPILLIDDDPTTCLVLKRALQRQGYEVVVANSGEEGLELAKKLEPGLIICDWMMPGLDGLQVCRQVKSSPNLSTSFFILLTARGAIEDRILGLDSGADEFISKPIDIGELQARVRAGFRVYQLSHDLHRQTMHLERELSEAAQYVQALLPDPVKYQQVQIETHFLPSTQLGGDCYDFQWLDEHHLAIYLVDVSGHGVGAALLSVSVLNLMRAKLLPQTNFFEPSSVLTSLNRAFCQHTEAETKKNSFFFEKYFTIWYGVYNTQSHHLIYASAGHPPALLITREANQKLSYLELSTPSLPIGLFIEAEYSSRSQIIADGNTLYIFSDGIYDFIGKDGLPWGLNSLAHLLIDPAIQSFNLETIVTTIIQLQDLTTFADDLSILRLKF